MKLKTKRFMKSPHIGFEKLKDPETVEVFQAKVGGKFAALCILDSHINTLANSLKKRLLLGDRGQRFNLGSQTNFWMCLIKDSS